jgi:hypothetical protein
MERASRISVFLMNLLSSTLETHALTLNQLERVDSELAQLSSQQRS